MTADDTDPASGEKDQLPAEVHKTSFLGWLESYLPFSIPRIPLPQTAKNLDQAAAKLVVSGASNLVSRVDASTERRKAIARGELAFIERGINRLSTGQVDNIDERSMRYVLNQAEVEQSNRENILKLTFNELESEPPQADATSEISADWLNLFAKIASDKTEADIQVLFAKILAGEIRQPGKTKISILSQLATLDKDDANFAYNFLQNVFNNEMLYQSYFVMGQPYVELLRARELGLVSGDSNVTLDFNDGVHVAIMMDKIIVMARSDTNRAVQMPVAVLTSFGKSLYRLIKDQMPDRQYVDSIVDYLHKQQLIVLLHNLSVK